VANAPNPSGPFFSAGQPIADEKDDRLGHWPLVQELANAIRHRSPSNGFVVGIEGEWGSGKSSITNLLERTLTSGLSLRTAVVRFSPWIVGTRSQLLGELFAELIRAAASLGPPPDIEWRSIDRIRRWWHLRKLTSAQRAWFDMFGGLAERLGQLGAVGLSLGVVEPVTGAAALAGVVGQQLRASRKVMSLHEMKTAIDAALVKLAGRLVVIIDDIDRLEPAEAVEVLRLVRSVADFSNTTYVLCYDREVLAAAVSSQLAVPDGADFIQKIVQLPFRVPRPEPFRLRHWFESRLGEDFSKQVQEVQLAEDREGMDRLSNAIDRYGGRYLRTARDVQLVLNSLALHAPALSDEYDFTDLVWISLVRHGNFKLFEWIEDYLPKVAALANGATLPEPERIEAARKLTELLAAEGLDVRRETYDLPTYLPGLDTDFLPQQQESKLVVFHNVTRHDLAGFIKKRRLGSPDHYRAYFAFWHPEGSVSEREVDQFLTLLDTDSSTAKKEFGAASIVILPGKVLRAERLLDQILTAGSLSEKQLSSLVESVVDGLDQAARALPSASSLWGASIWRRGEEVLRLVKQRLNASAARALLIDAFTTGRALGFLVNVLRHETFAHGLYGDQRRPEREWLLTETEFDEVAKVVRNRLDRVAPGDLLETPELLSLLFGWKQIGGGEQARAKVSAIVENDSQFLRFLSVCRGWTSKTSRRRGNEVLRPLRRHELANFLDIDEALKRLKRISDDAGASEDDQVLAKSLIAAFEQGEKG
jgi:KAP family P-loop domain